MNTRSLFFVTALTLAAVSAGVIAEAASTEKSAALQAKMEECFRVHGKLMSKPAVTNIHDCWRAHGYLMER